MVSPTHPIVGRLHLVRELASVGGDRRAGAPVRGQVMARSPLDPPLEKVVHRHVIDLFKRLGTVVYSTSQYRASHVAVGFPDLWCMHPRLAKAWFFEVKKYRKAGFHPMKPETWVPEPLRPEQAAFREHCIATGILHAWGGTNEAITFAEQIGLTLRSRSSTTAGRLGGVNEVSVEANFR